MNYQPLPEVAILPEWLDTLKSIIGPLAPNFCVWAYGSRVKGQYHSGSDLDLVLIHPENEKQACTNIGQIREAFNQSNIPILVQIHNWSELPETFKTEINTHKQRLF